MASGDAQAVLGSGHRAASLGPLERECIFGEARVELFDVVMNEKRMVTEKHRHFSALHIGQLFQHDGISPHNSWMSAPCPHTQAQSDTQSLRIEWAR